MHARAYPTRRASTTFFKTAIGIGLARLVGVRVLKAFAAGTLQRTCAHFLNGDEDHVKLRLEMSGGQCHTPEAGSRRPSYTPYGDQAAVLVERAMRTLVGRAVWWAKAHMVHLQRPVFLDTLAMCISSPAPSKWAQWSRSQRALRLKAPVLFLGVCALQGVS